MMAESDCRISAHGCASTQDAAIASFFNDWTPSRPTTAMTEPTTAIRRTRLPALVTSTPNPAAPKLFCPGCEQPLAYRQTVFGGVSPQERWDYFECGACGEFVYRERTRKLRRS